MLSCVLLLFVSTLVSAIPAGPSGIAKRTPSSQNDGLAVTAWCHNESLDSCTARLYVQEDASIRELYPAADHPTATSGSEYLWFKGDIFATSAPNTALAVTNSIGLAQATVGQIRVFSFYGQKLKEHIKYYDNGKPRKYSWTTSVIASNELNTQMIAAISWAEGKTIKHSLFYVQYNDLYIRTVTGLAPMSEGTSVLRRENIGRYDYGLSASVGPNGEDRRFVIQVEGPPVDNLQFFLEYTWEGNTWSSATQAIPIGGSFAALYLPTQKLNRLYTLSESSSSTHVYESWPTNQGGWERSTTPFAAEVASGSRVPLTVASSRLGGRVYVLTRKGGLISQATWIKKEQGTNKFHWVKQTARICTLNPEACTPAL